MVMVVAAVMMMISLVAVNSISDKQFELSASSSFLHMSIVVLIIIVITIITNNHHQSLTPPV